MTRGKAHTSATCRIDDCERPPRGRGLCSLHYRRWQRHGDPLAKLTNKGVPENDRFWLYVSRGVGAECWEWTGAKTHNGYGRFKRTPEMPMLAHRFAYELLVAPIPAGLEIDHLCFNPSCVNPAHLEAVTSRQNTRRRRVENRHRPNGQFAKHGEVMSDV